MVIDGEHQFEAITFDDIDRAAGMLEAMLSGLDVDTLTRDGATRLVKRLVVAERVVAAVRAKAAKRAADANQWRHAGERSPASWLASLTGTTTGQAAAELETTKKLVDLPATAAARGAGELSESQARQVADAATADPGAEADLLAHAATDDAAALARRCVAVKAAAERDETAARKKIHRARRHRSWTDGEGAFCYAGRGLPEDRAALEAALKPYQDQAFHAARRRGEREPAEAFAYDALIALGNHQCPPGAAATDTTPAPGPSDGNDGNDGIGRAARRSPTGETTDATTLWDGTTTDTSTATAEAAPGASTSDTAAPGDGPPRNGHGPPGTQPAGAATNEPFTDDRKSNDVSTSHIADPGDGQPHNGHGPPGTPLTTNATTGRTGTGDEQHAGDTVSGTGSEPTESLSTSDTTATASGTGPTSRLGPRAKVIVRIDHTALVRGHTVPGEVCEISGVGPIPWSPPGRWHATPSSPPSSPTASTSAPSPTSGEQPPPTSAPPSKRGGMNCAVPGCGAVHHLEIDHVDGWALTRRTHIDQLDWLCRHHHRQKTHDSYRLAGPPGRRTWHQPDREPPPATSPGPPTTRLTRTPSALGPGEREGTLHRPVRGSVRLDGDVQGAVGGPEGSFDVRCARAAGEDEAEVAVTLGQGLDRSAGGHGDLHPRHPGHGPGGVEAVDAPEGTAAGDGDHQHPGSSALPAEIAEREVEGVAEDHLLQADAGPEAQRAGAQPPDGPGCHLEDDHLPGRGEASLGVDGTVDEADGGGGGDDGAVEALDQRGRMAGRGDVERLLEVGAVEGVGLVERGQDVELPVGQQRLDRHLDAGHERLDEDGLLGPSARCGGDGPDPVGHRHRLHGGVGPDHPPASRQRTRLDHTGQPDGVGQLGHVVPGEDQAMTGLGQTGSSHQPAHGCLVPGGRHRLRWVVAQPEAGRRSGGRLHSLLVDGHHRRHRRPPVQGLDGVGRRQRIREGDDDGTVSHGRRHGLLLLGADHHLDAEGGGGSDEVGGPVRGRGHQQQDTHRNSVTAHRHRDERDAGGRRRIGAVDDTPAGNEGREADGATPTPLVTVTPQALKKVLDIRAGEPDGDALALWLEVSGAAAGEYTYDVYFDVVEAAAAEDAVIHHDDLTIVVPADSVERLTGASLGMSRDLLNPGLSVTNPNRPPAPPSPSPAVEAAAVPAGDLSGDVAQRVLQVLDRQINPSIASHGGRADLVAVEDDTAYLRLSGGCQGCGMASVTLGQGIEVAIKDNVPEIRNVVDVTDHAEGANPYYEAAKK